MIVVCGRLGSSGGSVVAAAEIAIRAATAGAAVQVVGVIDDDGEGDRTVLGLVTAGVGHAAVLRGPTRDLEPADVDLALRYLPDTRVVVTVDLAPDAVAAAAGVATWAAAAMVAVRIPGSGRGPLPDLSNDVIVLEAPVSDPDGTFAGFVGAFAANMDAGASAGEAWIATLRELAVDSISPAR